MSWCPHLRTDLVRKNRGVLYLKGLLLTISLAGKYPHCFFLSSNFFFCKQSKKGNFILAAGLADEVFIWSSEHICIQLHAVSDSIQEKNCFTSCGTRPFPGSQSANNIQPREQTVRLQLGVAASTKTHHRKRFHFLLIQPLYDKLL